MDLDRQVRSVLRGPLGIRLEPWGPTAREEAIGLFSRQVRGLLEGEVDGFILETFSDLRTAAAIYRSYGFRVVSEDHSPRWGRERFTYQRYELSLQDLAQSSSPASTGSSSRPFFVSA